MPLKHSDIVTLKEKLQTAALAFAGTKVGSFLLENQYKIDNIFQKNFSVPDMEIKEDDLKNSGLDKAVYDIGFFLKKYEKDNIMDEVQADSMKMAFFNDLQFSLKNYSNRISVDENEIGTSIRNVNANLHYHVKTKDAFSKLPDDHASKALLSAADKTEGELEGAFEDANLINIFNASLDYSNKYKELMQRLKKGPLTVDEEEIFRAELIEVQNNLNDELLEGLEANIDPNILYITGGNEDDYNDMVYGDKGFAYQKDILELERAYLKNGFPVAGISDFDKLVSQIKYVNKAYEIIDKGFILSDDIKKAHGEINEALKSLEKSSFKTDLERNAFTENLEEKVKVLSEKLIEFGKTNPAKNPNANDIQYNSALNQLKPYGELITALYSLKDTYILHFKLGDQRKIRELMSQRDDAFFDVATCIKDSENDLIKVRKELKKLGGYQDIIHSLDKAIEKCSNKKNTVVDIQKSMSEAVNNAGIAKSKKKDDKLNSIVIQLENIVTNFIFRKMAAINSGLDAGRNIYGQTLEISRKGENRLDSELTKFNTKRSIIFGKGEEGRGKESPEHKKLREEAETLQNMRDDLLNSGKYKTIEEWNDQARKVVEQAEKVMTAGKDYLDKKGYSANTPAGFDRMMGAIGIRREASLLGQSILKSVELNIQDMKNEEILKTLDEDIQKRKTERLDDKVNPLDMDSLWKKIDDRKKAELNKKVNVKISDEPHKIKRNLKNEINKKPANDFIF